jgi:hypothetical protein
MYDEEPKMLMGMYKRRNLFMAALLKLISILLWKYMAVSLLRI